MDRTKGVVALALVSTLGGVVARATAQTRSVSLMGSWEGGCNATDACGSKTSLRITAVDAGHVKVDGTIEEPHEKIVFSAVAQATDGAFSFETAIPPQTKGLIAGLFGGGKHSPRTLKGSYAMNPQPVWADVPGLEGKWEIHDETGLKSAAYEERLLHPGTNWKEFPMTGSWDGEKTIFADLKTQVREIQDEVAKKSSGVVGRGFHRKGFGLKARLWIRSDLPPDLTVGFARPRGNEMYDAIARFSNAGANSTSDVCPDQRGLAVRVKTGATTTLLSGATSDAQDFLTTNSPITARDPQEFIYIARAQLDPLRLPKVIEKFGVKETTYATTHLARGLDVIHSVGQVAQWNSRAPLKWGPLAVKVRFVPSRVPLLKKPWGGNDLPLGERFDADRLKDDLSRRLAASKDGLVLDMELQRFESEKTTPIEDGSIEWKTPWEKVGELWFPPQDLYSSEGAALYANIEAMAFTPWNCTEDFRPLGRLQRARKEIYASSAEHRGACPFGFGR